MRKLLIYVPVLLFTLLSASTPTLGSDTPSLRPQVDTLGVHERDTLSTPIRTAALGWPGMALRSNILYAATSTPNLGFDIALNEHFTLGLTASLKPWPRWLVWDYNAESQAKWRHFLISPEFRWWPDQTYEGWFYGADLLYAHFNLGALRLGLYPVLKEHRLQGDAFGAGLFAGHSWRLSEHWRLELAGGLNAAWINADRFDCARCGTQTGTERGVVVLPRLNINIVWDLPIRAQQREQLRDAIRQIEDVISDNENQDNN